MAQLTEQQYMIGRLPWVEVDRGDQRLQFARLDLSLIPDKSRPELEGILAENGIVSSRLPGRPGFLQVSLADQSGKNLDVLRMASTNWAHPVNNQEKLFAVGNEMHSSEFLDKAHSGSVNTHSVLNGLEKLYQRYGVALNVENGKDGKPYLVSSAEQSTQLTKLKTLPLALDNLPHDHKLEDGNAKPLADTKPTTLGRATAGAVFGVAAAIPAMIETYILAEQDVKNGQVPIGAANHATKLAAEAAAGGVAGSATAVAATPLLAIPPPAGEVAYGAAVMGAGYLGAEATKQLMEQADYYMAKAKTFFNDDAVHKAFNDQIRQNAQKVGYNPDLSVLSANMQIVGQTKSAEATTSQQQVEQGVER
jgi:hypothetical protein